MKMNKVDYARYIAYGANQLVKLAYKGNRPTNEEQRILTNTAQSFGVSFERAYNFGKDLSCGKTEQVAKRFKSKELELIAKHIDELILQAKASQSTHESNEEVIASQPEAPKVERTVFFSQQEANNYKMQAQKDAPAVVSYEDGDNYVPSEIVNQIADETRKGFLVLFKEWVITNSTLIANNLNDLSVNTRAVLNVARGDWSVNDYSISRLAQMHLKAMDELKALGGAN